MPVTIKGKEYEQVKERIPVFYKEYTDGRITTEVLSESENGVTIRASIFRDLEEQIAGAPFATGIAREERGGSISAYTENAETSAIGRALSNFNVYMSPDSERPSAEEMASVEELPVSDINDDMPPPAPLPSSAPVGSYDAGEKASAEAFGETPDIKAPQCLAHGAPVAMARRQGTARTGPNAGQPFDFFSCPEKGEGAPFKSNGFCATETINVEDLSID